MRKGQEKTLHHKVTKKVNFKRKRKKIVKRSLNDCKKRFCQKTMEKDRLH